MTIRLLRTLVAIADTRTFSAAASVVNVTHAAVSQQMQTLETDLGVTLFDRSTRSPELTPLGRQLVARARKLITEYDNLLPSILEDDGLEGGIRLGAIGTTLTGLMPQAMRALRSQFPHINIHIRPGLTGDLLADIERGNLDAALITRPHLVPASIQLMDLAKEPLELIASIDQTERDPEKLLNERSYIRFNRNAVLGTLIDNWISASGTAVTEAMELDSAEAVVSMVAADLGVSIMPRLSVPPKGEPALVRLKLGNGAPYRTLSFAYRKDQPKIRAMQETFKAFEIVIFGAKRTLL